MTVLLLCHALCVSAGVLAQTAPAPEPVTSPQAASGAPLAPAPQLAPAPPPAPASPPAAAPQLAPAPPAVAPQPGLPRVVPDASGGTEAAAAFRRLPVCALAPDGKSLLVEPCRPAPSRNFTQRRAVPQTIERMPPPTSSYRPPTAVPVLPAPPVPSVQGTTGPQPILGCDAAGCRDASGVRYQGGAGNVVLDPAGRQCTRNGAWVQCF